MLSFENVQMTCPKVVLYTCPSGMIPLVMMEKVSEEAVRGAALLVAIQGECRHRPEGVRTEKAGVGQGANRRLNRGDKKNTDRAT